MKKTLISLTVLFCSIKILANLVPNGSFEESKPGTVPRSWRVYNRGKIKAEFTVTDKTSATGKKALFIRNRSSYSPNKFADLHCKIYNMKVGVKYQLVLQAKGKSPQVDIFLGNWVKKWRLFYSLKDLGNEWRTYKMSFTVNPKDLTSDGAFKVRISIKKPTDGVWIDDIKIIPEAQVISAKDFQKNRILPITRFCGNLRNLKQIPATMKTLILPQTMENYSLNKMPSSKDLHAKAAIGWNDFGLFFLAEVFDSQAKTQPGSMMYAGDSIQLRIDQEFSLNNGKKGTDREIGFMPQANGVKTWCWQLNRELNPNEVEVYGYRDREKYFIAACIKWSFLNLVDFKNKGCLSFNIAVNDNDGSQRKVAFLASGLHNYKSSHLNTIALKDNARPEANLLVKEKVTNLKLDGKLYVRNLERKDNWQLNTVLVDAKGKSHHFNMGKLQPVKTDSITVINFHLPLKQISPGKYNLKIQADNEVLIQLSATKKNRKREQLRELSEIETQLNQLSQKLNKYYPNGKKSRYITLIETVCRRQIKLHRKELGKIKLAAERLLYLERGEIIIPELKQSLAMFRNYLKLLECGKKLPDTWGYVSSPIHFNNGWLLAKNRDDSGHEKIRKTFFVGYGHFAQVVRDTPMFQKIGANLIQIEIRPDYVFPTSGNNLDLSDVSLKRLDDFIIPALKRAWENDVRVCILLSPHLLPRWFWKQYPELKGTTGKPFEPLSDWNAPAYRRLLKAYLGIVIPYLKASPWSKAIHSLCLSNEAVYRECDWSKKPFRMAFIKWLENKYGSIDIFNKTSGCEFGEFATVAQAQADNVTIKYEFQCYKRETFSDFHRWLDGQVHRYWPDVLTSTKIMVFNTLKSSKLNEGVDPELFADFSSLNGNDNYMIYKHGKWISDWLTTSMSHDLQYSMKNTSIFNSENHVIIDQYKKMIPYGHIYTATFQQLMHGVGSIVTWVWQEADFKLISQRASRDGNISYRPINIIAQGNAALDGNRLSTPITRFVEYNPQVALLYSPTSYIHTPYRYSSAVKKLYETLSFTGYKLGFISEKQLASGNFKNVKVLFVPNAAYIRRDAAKKLEEFIKTGGRVITYGNSLKFNQFGHKLNFKAKTFTLAETALNAVALRKLINLKTPVVVEAIHANGNAGVVWRMVPDGNSWLMNLVNYNFHARRLKVKIPDDMKITNLITGKTQAKEFDLKPLQPLLLKIIK